MNRLRTNLRYPHETRNFRGMGRGPTKSNTRYASSGYRIPGALSSAIGNFVFFQPLSGNLLKGCLAVPVPRVLQAQLPNRMFETAKRPLAVDGRDQLCATPALFIFQCEVLHHAPFVDMRAVRQLQHALVFQGALDLRQVLLHPFRSGAPFAALGDARFFLVEGNDLACIRIKARSLPSTRKKRASPRAANGAPLRNGCRSTCRRSSAPWKTSACWSCRTARISTNGA